MAKELGVDQSDQAAFLVSIMGISNTICCVVVGVAAFKIPAHPLFLLTFGHLLGGAFTMLISLYTTYALLAAYSGLFGIVYGKHQARTASLFISVSLCTTYISRIFSQSQLMLPKYKMHLY